MNLLKYLLVAKYNPKAAQAEIIAKVIFHSEEHALMLIKVPDLYGHPL
jgi:hypothetical protein